VFGLSLVAPIVVGWRGLGANHQPVSRAVA